MLEKTTTAEIAARLDAAERTGVQIAQLSQTYPGMTVEDGYGIQREWIARKLAAGRRIKGHKIGLTSRAMQRSSQIDEPDHGVLLDDMFFAAGADIPFERFIEPRVEVELAFILGKPLSGPDCTLFDVLSATDFVVPAVEIIDARIQRVDPSTGAARKVVDTIADNAANAGIVLGGRPVKPDGVDLRWVSALCHQNGVIEESGVAAAVLNHPANGIAWLVNKLHRFGLALQASQVVLAGSFTRSLAAARGDSFHVDYGALGSIAFRFT
jgi:2-oxo-hept-3-ene-1,7-dioate hydratase